MIRHLAALIFLVLLSLVASVASADDPAVVEVLPAQIESTKDDKTVAVDEYRTIPVRDILETSIVTPVLPSERTMITR